MTGCLLIHGFGGSPFEMQPLAGPLEGHGCRVLSVCLPGHGTNIADFMRTDFFQWQAFCDDALQTLARDCENIVVIGLSMGGTLALSLAARFPVAGVVSIAAPVFIYRYLPWRMRDLRLPLLPWLAKIKKNIAVRVPGPESRAIAPWDGYEGVMCLPQLASLMDGVGVIRKQLHRVTVPLLLMQDRRDRLVEVDNLWDIAKRVRSTSLRIRLFGIEENITSRHLLTTHRETKDDVIDEIIDFLRHIE